MAKLEARAEWQGGMEYLIHAGDHRLTIDAPEIYGGQNHGPKPTYMLLAGLMGCSGMDVASLLRKMRVPAEKITLETSADVAETDPHVFTGIRMDFRIDGPAALDQHLDAMRRAIRTSREKLCCVSIMLSKACPITLRAFANGVEFQLD